MGSHRQGLDAWIIAVVLASVTQTASVNAASAGEIGHYSAALADVRDYVMPANPGFYFKEYDLFYTSDAFHDRNGHKASSIDLPNGGKVDVDVNVDLYVLAPTFMWISDWKILGARYGAYAIPTFGNTSVDAALTTLRGFGRESDEGNFGVGDMFVQPVWLGWNLKNWDFATGYGFYAPIGKYEQGASDNIGLGFWTHQFQAAVAWYPDEKRGTAVVAAVTYEINSNVEGADVTPGQRINANLGIDHYVTLGESGFLMDLGAGAYGQWQVTDDTGSDAFQGGVHDHVYGVGPQIGITYVPWGAAATAKWMHELGSENRFEGDYFTLNFAVSL